MSDLKKIIPFNNELTVAVTRDSGDEDSKKQTSENKLILLLSEMLEEASQEGVAGNSTGRAITAKKSAEGKLSLGSVAPSTASNSSDDAAAAEALKEVEDSLNKLAGIMDPTTLSNLLDELNDTFKKYQSQDPAKLKEMLNKLLPILQMIGARNSDKADAILKALTSGGLLDKLFGMDSAHMDAALDLISGACSDITSVSKEEASAIIEKAMAAIAAATQGQPGMDAKTLSDLKNFLESYTDAGTASSPNYASSLVRMMAALEMLQVALMKNQGDQAKRLSIINDSLLSCAQDQVKGVQKSLDDYNAQQASISKASLVQQIVGYIVAAVAVGVAFFFSGPGAALVAAGIGAFMMSGGFTKMCDAISTAIEPLISANELESDTENYKKKGYSDADATRLAKAQIHAEAQVIAKVAGLILVTAFTVGVGGVTVGVDAAAEEVGEVVGQEVGEDLGMEMVEMGGEEMGEAAGESAVETGSQSATGSGRSFLSRVDVDWSKKGVAFMAASEGLSTIASSGIVMDAMNCDQSFIEELRKKGDTQTLAIINAVVSLVAVIGSMVAGYKGMKARTGENFSQLFPTSTGKLIVAGVAVEILGTATSATASGVEASVLGEQYDTLSALAGFQRGVMYANMGSEINQKTLERMEKSSGEAVKSLGEAENRIVSRAGNLYEVFNRQA